MTNTRALMELYQALWLSADFESDLATIFPDEFKKLKKNENSLTDKEILAMYSYMYRHPVFN